MTTGDENPHFISAESWAAAGRELSFTPRPPDRTGGRELESIRIHVRDHRRRELPVGDRTLEAHYGAFVVSQQRAATAADARALAFDRPYGADPSEGTVAGHRAVIHDLGPEPPADDIDPRSPAVITWADGDVFHMVASGELDAAGLADIAASIYG